MKSRNQMKTQKVVIFLKKNLKINMLKIKNTAKLDTIVIIQINAQISLIAYVI